MVTSRPPCSTRSRARKRTRLGTPERPGQWNGGGVDAGDVPGDLVRGEYVAVVAERQLVLVLAVQLLGPVLGQPCQSPVEAQPARIRVAREQGAVAIDRGHPQPVVVLAADAGGVQPGQGAA